MRIPSVPPTALCRKYRVCAPVTATNPWPVLLSNLAQYPQAFLTSMPDFFSHS